MILIIELKKYQKCQNPPTLPSFQQIYFNTEMKARNSAQKVNKTEQFPVILATNIKISLHNINSNK